MRITDHRLSDVAWRESPNQGERFVTGQPDTLVLHFTAGDTAQWAIDTLCDPTPGSRVSSHLVIGRDGAITQLLPFDTIGWHAGRSAWSGRSEFNQFSLGIEIDNAGRLQPDGAGFVSAKGGYYDRSEVVQATHRHESEPGYWHRYPAAQLQQVESVSRALVQTYNLRWIVGHDEIAPDRKEDPGPAFPMAALRARLLGAPMSHYDGAVALA